MHSSGFIAQAAPPPPSCDVGRFKWKWFRTRENLIPRLAVRLYESFLILGRFHIGGNSSSSYRIHKEKPRPQLRCLLLVAWDKPPTGLYYIPSPSLMLSEYKLLFCSGDIFDILVSQLQKTFISISIDRAYILWTPGLWLLGSHYFGHFRISVFSFCTGCASSNAQF